MQILVLSYVASLASRADINAYCQHLVVRDYDLKTIPTVFKQSLPDEPCVSTVFTTAWIEERLVAAC
ncbi:45897_t:CDS:2 [Gigaspora margarita]|uniref:45897_t:CDS:1 n=1 Tax=Gigaspora margarita TaxID=4874 RepID=A0ABN7UZ98_GIGMA|nr:45897_t:CDS:2 [Gigaspora margarita]